jgi:hypothetical protein
MDERYIKREKWIRKKMKGMTRKGIMAKQAQKVRERETKETEKNDEELTKIRRGKR